MLPIEQPGQAKNISGKGENAGNKNFAFSHYVCNFFEFGQVNHFVVWNRVNTSMFTVNAFATKGFCPEIKSTGTNGPLSLKKVGHFRKYGAQYDANSLSAFRQVEKTKELLNYS